MGLQRGSLFNRCALGLAVDRGRGGKHKPLRARCLHRLQQRERGACVVAEKAARVEHALTSLNQRGKVQHSIKPGGAEHIFHQSAVSNIPLNKLRCCRNTFTLAVGKVIENGYSMALPQ